MPKQVYLISAVFVIISAFGNYLIEISSAFLTLIFIFKLFWKKGVPPVILAGVFFQWFAVTSGYIYLSLSSAEMVDLLWRPEYSLDFINETYYYSIVGIIIFSIGTWHATKNIKYSSISRELLEKYDTKKAIIMYSAFSFGAGIVLKILTSIVPGLAAPLTTLLYFKWVLLFLVVNLAFVKNEYKKMVLSIILFEVLLGFTGFFSSFKDILILFPIIFITNQRIDNPKNIMQIVFIAILLFNLGVVWTAVKEEYREYLSGGRDSQVVRVSKLEAFNKFTDLVSNVTSEDYSEGIEGMIKRFFFLEYFSATVKNIPQSAPHTGGKYWIGALEHIFMPRILFPNKESIDDSEQTRELTGIQEVSGAESGVSITTGYFASAYADYGPVYMYIPIYLLGYLLGFVYKFFIKKIDNPLWAYGFLIPMYFLFNIFSKNIVKISGYTFMYLIVFSLIISFALPIVDKRLLRTL
ncbi:hypothetical protein [Formosa sp. S-31]|uniref:hypothetical protein n=1 Tax=Formosa sp. S-31 TaxID=2790949 RepID=UPI003EBC7D46